MTFSAPQKGASLVGGLLVLVVVVFVANAAFKLVPHYLDYMTMKKIIGTVESNPSLAINSASDFYSYVDKSMQLNSIRDIDLNKALRVTVENNTFNAHLNYEQRESLISNIYVVIKFDKQMSVGRP